MMSGRFQRVEELIVRVIHLVGMERCHQTRPIERCVMGHKWQAFYLRLDLFPHLAEYRCTISIGTGEPMHLRTSPLIVIWFRLYKRIERVNKLSIPYYHYSYRAYTTSLKVSCFKVNCRKVLHSLLLIILVVYCILNL